MKIGYARVSTVGQNLQSQIDILKSYGCEKIFTEKKSGSKSDNRIELQNAIDFAREGDEFVVTRLDRCSRNVKDLHSIIDKLEEKSVSFKSTEQEIDTSTSSGRLMIGLLSIVAAFELDLRAERQAAGIEAAKKRGVRFGVKKKLTDDQVQEAISMQNNGMFNQDIANHFNIARSTLLRYLSEYKKTINYN